MGYGIKIKKIKRTILEKSGYVMVPNHVYGMQVSEQWINNINALGTSTFPRFHIIKENKDWFIHRDVPTEDGHRAIITMTPEIKLEIKRLNIIYYDAYDS